ncbi:MAG: hypothetical protein ABI376_04240 [Caulobacteraceae bacterium]
MNETPSPPSRRRGRFWLTIGEVAAVLAVAIAALNYWDAHRQHAAEERAAGADARARAALVLTATADDKGRHLMIRAMNSAQAIQSQRYIFPTAVLGHPMEVAAARPQIGADWISGGLGHALDEAKVKGAGEAHVPVAIVTTWVEDGETRTDSSLYRIGWSWRPRFLFGRDIVLQGMALIQRGAKGDLRAEVNARWAAARAALASSGTPASAPP